MTISIAVPSGYRVNVVLQEDGTIEVTIEPPNWVAK